MRAHTKHIGARCGTNAAPALTATAPVLGGKPSVRASGGPTGQFGALLLGEVFAATKPYLANPSAQDC